MRHRLNNPLFMHCSNRRRSVSTLFLDTNGTVLALRYLGHSLVSTSISHDHAPRITYAPCSSSLKTSSCLFNTSSRDLWYSHQTVSSIPTTVSWICFHIIIELVPLYFPLHEFAARCTSLILRGLVLDFH